MEIITYLIVALLTSLLLFLVAKYSYWRRKKVVGPTPVPLFGNYFEFLAMKKVLWFREKEIYDDHPDAPFIGTYLGTTPVFIPKDLEVIKTIMTKDFHKFSGRLLVEHEFRDPDISSNLFFSSGDKWKTLRQNLNPLFTTGKLKHFFTLVMQCADKFDVYLDDIHKQSDVQDVKKVCTNFILECVGTTLFGMKFEAMVPEDTVIKKMAKKLVTIEADLFIKNNLREMFPNVYHFFSSRTPVSDAFSPMFAELAHQSFASRNFKPSGRNDLIDFLLKFKEQKFLEGGIIKDGSDDPKRFILEANDSLLIAQVLVFFGAGFNTSAVAMSFTLYELAKNAEIQTKLIREIDDVVKSTAGDITYESIQNMKYLDMVVSETLRKYPVLGVLTRECMEDHTFEEYGVKLDKGTRIHIPVWSIHHDPKYYPEPLKYDPERFSPEQLAQRHQYCYLAFGEGHRICIGRRYSKIQVTVGLIKILSKYSMAEDASTPNALQFDKKGFTTACTIPIWLKIVPRKSTAETEGIDGEAVRPEPPDIN